MFGKLKILFNTGFFHIFGSNIFNKILSFLSNALLVRILTKTEFGTFTYTWNIYGFILIFNGMGICNGALQVGSEKWDNCECEAVFKYSLKNGCVFDIFISIVIVAIAAFYPVTIENSRTLLYMLCGLPCIQFVYDLMLIYLRVKRKNKKFALVSIINAIFICAFSIIGTLVFREEGLIIGKYLGYIITICLSVLVLHLIAEGNFKNNIKLNKKDIRAIGKISSISMLNNGISQLLYLLDIFLLGIIVADENILAGYKVATMLPTAILFIPSALATYLYPYFAAHIEDRAWCFTQYKKVFTFNILFNFFTSSILYFSAPVIIKLLFGRQYVDIVPIFRILIVSYFFSSSFRILSSNLLVAYRKLKFNFFEALISGISNIILDYFLIKLWGGIGAAIATCLVVLISSIISTTYLIYVYKR